MKETQKDEGRKTPEVYKVVVLFVSKFQKVCLISTLIKKWSHSKHKISKAITAEKNRTAKNKISGRKDDKIFVRRDLRIINGPEKLEMLLAKRGV